MNRYHNDVFDNGLDEIKQNGNALHLIDRYVADQNRTTVLGNSLGSAALTPADLVLGNITNGRELVISSGKSLGNSSGTVATNEDTGTATSAGTNTLTDSAKSWTTNAFAGFQVTITGGTGSGQVRTIISNTATQLTVHADWTVQPDGTSTYEVKKDLHYAVVDATRVLAVVNEPSDQTVTTGNPISAGSVTMNMTQPTS